MLFEQFYFLAFLTGALTVWLVLVQWTQAMILWPFFYQNVSRQTFTIEEATQHAERRFIAWISEEA